MIRAVKLRRDKRGRARFEKDARGRRLYCNLLHIIAC